ncbi:MAG: hypothetical protein BAJALOKI1v1_260024 [Promethearchaeota archaeon]|nr:MAG: hypothetical protein BAJALOKI1v1_260024 [Candidatus Lokiarchaeota archaeon]
MICHKRINKLKLILVISSISFSFLFILLLVVLKDIPILSSLIKNYIDCGESIFIPSIPTQNLIGGISERFPNANFTLGHLIDLLIIINIVLYTEASIYHYIKRVCLTNYRCGYLEFTVLNYSEKTAINNTCDEILSSKEQINHSFPHIFNKDGRKRHFAKSYRLEYKRVEECKRKRKKYAVKMLNEFSNVHHINSIHYLPTMSLFFYLFFLSRPLSLWDIYHDFPNKKRIPRNNSTYFLISKYIKNGGNIIE